MCFLSKFQNGFVIKQTETFEKISAKLNFCVYSKIYIIKNASNNCILYQALNFGSSSFKKKTTGRLTYRVIYLNVVFLRPRQLAILSTHQNLFGPGYQGCSAFALNSGPPTFCKDFHLQKNPVLSFITIWRGLETLNTLKHFWTLKSGSEVIR